ncbi:MAG TPA: hypothetical protein PKD24_05685 [Pyrinomonadaceae bacterium]|nr:hypothetical protein [Pyrinomonadaceae bacterium]HMP65042.1 hypothetical protein [Pyrinomonadaceae bacterium]
MTNSESLRAAEDAIKAGKEVSAVEYAKLKAQKEAEEEIERLKADGRKEAAIEADRERCIKLAGELQVKVQDLADAEPKLDDAVDRIIRSVEAYVNEVCAFNESVAGLCDQARAIQKQALNPAAVPVRINDASTGSALIVGGASLKYADRFGHSQDRLIQVLSEKVREIFYRAERRHQ